MELDNKKYKHESAINKYIEELSLSNKEKKYAKNMISLGVFGGAYFGLRSFIGPEIDVQAENIKNLWQILDPLNLSLSGTGIIGAFAYGSNYIMGKLCERRIKKEQSGLEEISKECANRVSF
ncbi:MAG: hypothetical protein ACP5NZ_00450 [Nanobdellota archaeon]